MIEIRTFDDDPAKLGEFCTRIWRERYRDKMPVADWTGPFMEWELMSEEPGARDFLVVAYDGTKLVGSLPAKPVMYQLNGRQILGTLGCFLAIDPAYENQAVSLKMVLEQRRRHRDR